MLAACGTGNTQVDPADLDLRDLLGMAPNTATGWDADQRASARKLITDGLKDGGATLDAAVLGGASQDVRIAKTLAAVDSRRAADGQPALGMVRIALDTTMVVSETIAPTASAALGGISPPVQEVWLAEQWDQQNLSPLAGRGLDLMSALATDAGLKAGPVVVVPVAHLAAIAAYIPAQKPGDPARLIVNPIALAALEPNEINTTGGSSAGQAASDPKTAAAVKQTGPIVPPAIDKGISKAVGGNPYSFYGSYEECAAAQRDRCESCMSAGNCHPITNTADGAGECTMLDANNGKGYYELCINLSLAISSVNNCVASHAPSCPRNASAADSITTLAANDEFLTDGSCSTALDNCLADIYGAPKGNFPDPIGPDGGIAPPSTDPPRDVSPSCGHGCSNNTTVDPSCDCKGGNCGNSLTCSSACAASNSQSGCGGDASGCNSDDGNDDSGSCEDNGGSEGDNGSCSGSNDSDTGSCSEDNSGDSCSGGSSESDGGSCDNSSSSSDSCGSGSSSDSCSSSSGSDSGCSSSSSGGDSCSSSSGGGDSCGGSSGSSGCSSSGSSGSGCSAAKKEPSAVLAIAVSATWGFMPVPIAAWVKRRSNRKKKQKEVQS